MRQLGQPSQPTTLQGAVQTALGDQVTQFSELIAVTPEVGKAQSFEVKLKPGTKLVGVLNDDSNPVGAVHLGLVFVADAQGRPVSVRETNKLSGQFATLDEVSAVADRMETWSSLLLDFLIAQSDRSMTSRIED